MIRAGARLRHPHASTRLRAKRDGTAERDEATVREEYGLEIDDHIQREQELLVLGEVD